MDLEGSLLFFFVCLIAIKTKHKLLSLQIIFPHLLIIGETVRGNGPIFQQGNYMILNLT